MSSTTPTSTFTPPGLSSAAADPTGAPASASSGATISTGNSGPSTSSSLYLYTFLVTLALLLSISAAIITRSYVLRRRLRALVAAGVLPPEALIHTPRRHGGLGGNVNVGKRPVMYEVWPAEKSWEGEGGGEGGSVGEKAAPLSLAPLAALLAAQAPPIVPESAPRRSPRPVQRPSFAVPFFSRRDPYSPTPAPAPVPSPQIATGSPQIPSTQRWRPFTRPTKPPADPETELTNTNTNTTRSPEVEDMQLALLVAMPVEPGTKGRGTGEVPVLEIGVRVVAGRVS